MNSTGSRAVGYVRVSTDDQSKEGFSLDAQEAGVRAYALMKGFDLVGIYREEGVSGKTLLSDRPEGSKVVELLSKRKATHVIATKLDRLFRNAVDALGQTQEWDRSRCTLHLIDMGGSAVDTSSAMGRMFLTMMAAFAEMERNLISERTVSALQHKKRSGLVYTGIAPLGFKRDGGCLVKDDAEMAVVCRIQAMRAAGQTVRSIVAELNAEGVPTKCGGHWHLQTVQNIIHRNSPIKDC